MTSGQARKEARQGLKQSARCPRCGRLLPRAGGYLVVGLGICCARCAGKLQAAR
jgi:hypothetical protein